MYKWLYDPNITFHMWQKAHLITIAIIIIITLSLYYFKKELVPYRRMIRISIGWILIMSRISLDAWYLITDQWQVQSSLPLELCSIASIVCGMMLLTKNRHLFEIFYFIAIGGAIQAIITPDLNFGFPQYRYIQFFLDHFLLFISPLIMVWLYGYSITRKSLMKSFITLNIMAGIVFIINTLLSANYMFLREKPSAGSLLDFLGPYPYYIISLELVALFIFFILYVPFIFLKQDQKNSS